MDNNEKNKQVPYNDPFIPTSLGKDSETPNPTLSKDNEVTHKQKNLIVERRPKDIHFEGYEDLHYIIKNISSRHRITFAQLACDLLETELKRRFKSEYKEFSELYKKLNT